MYIYFVSHASLFLSFFNLCTRTIVSKSLSMKEEQKKLQRYQETNELDQLLEETNELMVKLANEDSPEIRATLPKLSLDQLPRVSPNDKIYSRTITTDVQQNAYESGVTVIRHALTSSSSMYPSSINAYTNDIFYIDFGLDVSMLPIEDIPLLSLFTRLLIEGRSSNIVDAGGTDTGCPSIDIAKQIGIYTGGVKAVVLIQHVYKNDNVVPDDNYISSKLFIRGSCMKSNVSKLLDLIRIILFDGSNGNGGGGCFSSFSQEKVINILKDLINEK